MKKSVYLFIAFALVFSCSKKEEEIPQYKKVLTETEISDIINKVKNMEGEDVLPGEIGIIETEFGTIKIKFFPEVLAKYDEKLDLYEVDLSEYAGKKVSFILRVEDVEGNLYQQNNAVWINPLVTQ